MKISIFSFANNLYQKISVRSKRALALFVIFYIALGAVMYFFQERLVYQPSVQDFAQCPALSDALQISHQGTRVYVGKEGKGAVVIYHGNAGSACDRVYLANAVASAGYRYILPEYSGYSNDPEKPSHVRIKTDVRNVVDLLETSGLDSVFVIGESVGTGIAAYHASVAPPERLLLVSPFKNLTEVARHHYWFYPVSFLIDDAYRSDELLRDYKGSVLVMHGEEDEIIPYESGKRLYESLVSEKKEFVSLPNVGHNDVFTATEAFVTLQRFLVDE